jgi:hypothetical protein
MVRSLNCFSRALANINLLLILAGFATMIDIYQVKYLNNIIERVEKTEQDKLEDAGQQRLGI